MDYVVAVNIARKLSPDTLNVFSLVNTTINIAAKHELANPLYWKGLLEDIVDLDLSFQGNAGYWRELYDEFICLKQDSLYVNAYDTGRYEYIYIATQKGTTGHILTALRNAAKIKCLRTVNLLSKDDRFVWDYGGYAVLNAAIYAGDDEIFYTLMENVGPVPVKKPKTPAETHPFETAASVGRVDYMKAIYERFLGKYNIFNQIAEYDLPIEDKTNVLKYFLSLGIKKDYMVGDYLTDVVSDEEIDTMIDSGRVLFHSNDPTKNNPLYKLTAEQSYKIYLLRDKKETIYELIENILEDSDVLSETINTEGFAEGISFLYKKLLKHALSFDNDSFRLLVEKFGCRKDIQRKISRKDEKAYCIEFLERQMGNMYPSALSFICKRTKTSAVDLENMIFKNPRHFKKRGIDALISMGVSLKMVWRIIAFHSKRPTINYLSKLGFPVEGIVDDLFRNFSNLDITDLVYYFGTKVLKGSRIDIRYFKKSSDYYSEYLTRKTIKNYISDILEGTYTRFLKILTGTLLTILG